MGGSREPRGARGRRRRPRPRRAREAAERRLSAYEVRRLEDFEAIPVEGAGITWRPVRRTLGIRAFGINAYTAGAGEQVVEEHTEDNLGHEEVYVVVAGRARFTVGGDEVEADAGTLVYVREPTTRRAAVALEDGTLVLAVGGKPGTAYEPSAWEWFFAARPLRERGDHAAVQALLREGLEAKPGHPALLYHLACSEALAGDRDAALEHVRQAVETEPRFAEYARDEEDFDAIRDDPRFPG